VVKNNNLTIRWLIPMARDRHSARKIAMRDKSKSNKIAMVAILSGKFVVCGQRFAIKVRALSTFHSSSIFPFDSTAIRINNDSISVQGLAPIDSDLEHVVWMEMLQLTKWIVDTIMAVIRVLQIKYEYKNLTVERNVKRVYANCVLIIVFIENKIKLKTN